MPAMPAMLAMPIKLAMLATAPAPREGGLAGADAAHGPRRAVFEAPPDRAEAISGPLKAEMEQVYTLSVPLVVDIDIAGNWADA